jgi:hypothetical protein
MRFGIEINIVNIYVPQQQIIIEIQQNVNWIIEN